MTETNTTQVNLTFTPEYGILGAQPTRLTFNAHLKAPEVLEDAEKRSTVSLTAVIDKSGSMRGKKLELVKKTCNFMLNQLSSNDKLGLVEYDTFVNELIPLSKANEPFKAEASEVIDSMATGSCTNLSGGLFEGVKQQQGNTFVDWTKSPIKPEAPGADAPAAQTSPEQEQEQPPIGDAPAPRLQQTCAARNINVARQRSTRQRATKKFFEGTQPGTAEPVEEDALRSVFLFTDGLANEGITNTGELVAALGEQLDASPRVRVYTFGFGEDHSPELLAELGRVGAGTYYFMEKEEAIPTAFADALGGLLSVAAQNVTLEFRPAAGVAVKAVHTAYTTSEGSEGGRSVAVGDLLSEEGKDLLFEVELGAWEGEEGAEVEVGRLVVKYLDVQGATLREEEVGCRVRRVREVPTGEAANEGVALQRARVETAAGLAEARQAAESGDLEGARGRLQACLEQVQTVASEGAFKTQLCQDLLEAQTNMVDRRTYASRGSKLMWAKGKAHMEQRSACLSDDEDEFDGAEAAEETRKTFSYANSAQKVMRKKAKGALF